MPLRFRVVPAPPAGRAARVAAVASAGLAEGPTDERAFEVDAGLQDVRIGRQRGVEIELPFPAVSALHARLLRGETSTDWQIEDLGSMNGTWLDGQRLFPHQAVALRPGQRLRVAAVDIIFDGWSTSPQADEGTTTIARRLISDLFGAVGGEVPTLTVESGAAIDSILRLTERDRQYLAGRSPACDLVLASDHVSREHASFVRRADGVLVSDLGSKNGLQVNGHGIAGEHRLADGDRISVGVVTLRFTDPEDRYLRRLGSFGSASSPRNAAANDERDPQGSLVSSAAPGGRIATPILVPAAGNSAEAVSAASPSPREESLASSRAALRRLGTTLVVGVVLAALAGLMFLWLATTH